jgi:hypothetical protein
MKFRPLNIQAIVLRSLLFLLWLWVINLPIAFVLILFRGDLDAHFDENPSPGWREHAIALLLVALPAVLAWRFSAPRHSKPNSAPGERARERDLSDAS